MAVGSSLVEEDSLKIYQSVCVFIATFARRDDVCGIAAVTSIWLLHFYSLYHPFSGSLMMSDQSLSAEILLWKWFSCSPPLRGDRGQVGCPE